MPSYQCGSTGPDVVKIQTQLQQQKFYNGPLDGNFGGGTESAVKLFQRAAGLGTDGVVGSETWAKLFPDHPPTIEPTIKGQSLGQRCLALTGSFETNSPPPECYAGLTGNFDGQGMSIGACQWNLGQRTLQPLFSEMAQTHATVLDDLMHDYAGEFRRMLSASIADQLAWADSIQDARHQIIEPWQGLFKSLARTLEFQAIEVAHAARLQSEAAALCQIYGVTSERAIALMFDIKVQNGGISDIVKARIERDFGGLAGSLSAADAEVARLRIIANRRAEAAASRWVEDVRVRKLVIANGAGIVHGRNYDLEAQYGLTLKNL